MNVSTLLESFRESKPRVISYTRFSSRKQAKGTSYVRQVESAKAWCDKHGLSLASDGEYEDLGVSAYSGANSSTGALSVLQSKLAAGEIPRGTVLLVEALDRLTRQSLPQAITLLMNLANSGLNVVTMTDPDKVWNEQSMLDLGSFLMSVVTLYRGHQESEYKSLRLRATFKKHRKTGSQQAFGAAPGWLQRESKAHPWEVIEEKAAVVRRVFELSAAGLGSKVIAARANAEGWVVPTRLARTGDRWHGQMPGQLLRNRSVLGEHQHRIRTHEAKAQHWHGLLEGEPIQGYYPQIVTDELWHAARASIRERSVNKRRDEHYYNIWSGLMYCGCCGAAIHRKTERNGYSRAQLQCSHRIGGATTCPTMSARNADFPLLQAIYLHSHVQLANPNAVAVADEVVELEARLAENEEEAQLASDLVFKTGGKVPAFVARSVRLAEEADELKLQIQDIRSRRVEDVDSEAFDDAWLEEAMSTLYVSDDEDAKEARAALNLRLARIVETIWVFAYDCAFIKFKGEPLPMAVQLPAKRLPSRANPSAKYHKPPKERPEPPKPVWDSHLIEELELPEPKRAAAMSRKMSELLVNYQDAMSDAVDAEASQ